MDGRSAIDDERLPLHEVGKRRGKEQDGVGHVGRFQHPIAHHRLLFAACEHLRGTRQAPRRIGLHEPGLDDVDIHAAVAEFERPVAGEGRERRLRAADQAIHRQRHVGAVAREHDRLAAARRRLEERRRRLEQVDERQHIRVHRGIEVALGGGGQGAKTARGGIVHEDVEATEFGLHEADHLVDVFLLTDVGADAGGIAPHGGDRLGHLFRLAGARDVIDDDVGPGFGEPEGTGLSDAAARAGDEGHFSGEIDHERRS